jgi:flavin reductase (DIM6/NTAB) family NADH-FMN oxidoreductase RutF
MSEILGRMGGPRDEQLEDEAQPPALEPDAQGARWIRRHLAGSVVALTTVRDGAYGAVTISACIPVSIEPFQVLVSIEIDSQMDTWLRSSSVFGLSILTWRQQFLADQFAGFAPSASSTFRGIDHFTAVTGAPLLTESVGWVDCRVVSTLETGDHRCVVGEAVATGSGTGNADDPLVYYLSRYRRFR